MSETRIGTRQLAPPYSIVVCALAKVLPHVAAGLLLEEVLVSPTSIVLVHAHALFREGLRHNLASLPDFRIVGEASNGQQAIQLVDYTDPTIVLMEVDLPGVNGLEVARAIKRMLAPSIVNVTPSLESLSAGRRFVGTTAAVLVIMSSSRDHGLAASLNRKNGSAGRIWRAPQ